MGLQWCLPSPPDPAGQKPEPELISTKKRKKSLRVLAKENSKITDWLAGGAGVLVELMEYVIVNEGKIRDEEIETETETSRRCPVGIG